MGLAPYGEPRYMREMRQIVRLQEDGRFELNLDYFPRDRKRSLYLGRCARGRRSFQMPEGL